MIKLINQLLLLLTVSLLVTHSVSADAQYTFSVWPNGWRKNANDKSPDIFFIETSQYGFSLNVSDFKDVKLGLLKSAESYEKALTNDIARLNELPDASLLIELEIDGNRYQAKACRAGLEKGKQHLSHARLWESGRFVQHYDFQGLDFSDANENRLICDATLDLVAWPGNLSLSLQIAPNQNFKTAILRIGLDSTIGNWVEEKVVAGPWQKGQSKELSLICPLVSSVDPAIVNALSVRAGNKQSIPIKFDSKKNCVKASVSRLKRSWKTGYTDIRHYDDFEITVNPSDTTQEIPFLLDIRPPANITGVCPVLCDKDGVPTGIPVQLGKNWHEETMGSYLMVYTLLPANVETTYTLRLVYGFYGSLPSASHAQLSLIGYRGNGGNGRWDQLAIGCWGETICFDMDMSLVDVAITDIRMLMTRKGLNGKKWSWTEAGWGGDWLDIQDANQQKYYWTDLKTAYLAHGPCLTNVKYQGAYGANREIDFSAQVQTLRTDDYSRSFQSLTYKFKKEVTAQKISLYKLGRTFDYKTPKLVYGNNQGLISELSVPATLKPNDYLLKDTTLTGDSPYWVALPEASQISNSKPNGYRALVIRQYKVIANGETYLQPTISAPVYKSVPTNLDIEIVPPPGITEFRKGDQIELEFELITLPRESDDYYGPNAAFRQQLTKYPNSWKTTFIEATGNDLKINVKGGNLLNNYPVVIQAVEPQISFTIKGGVGFIPIRFDRLKYSSGYNLYQIDNGRRIKLDQSVHGNDFWQTDYDSASDSYSMSFNLPIDESNESQWVLIRE